MNTNSSSMQRSSNKTTNKPTKKVFFKKRQGCPLSGIDAPKIDYKDPVLLSKFISPESCRMMPSRVTSVCARKQRELRKAIKIARILALMPFVFQKELNER